MRPVVVVTASPGTFPDLAANLGDTPVVLEERPLIDFEPPGDWSQLDSALDRLGSFEAVALTSPRAARVLAERAIARGAARQGTPQVQVWAVGQGTARALGDALGPVRVPAPDPGVSPAVTLAQAILDSGCKGPVLFPCGEQRRDDLPRLLRAQGCEVQELICYRSVLASRSEAGAAAARASILVVASPSVMNLLADSCPPGRRPLLIAIGPTTSAAARAADWPPAAVAEESSSERVAGAIAGLLAARQP
jgi:uroporphyrinogen-III synthase